MKIIIGHNNIDLDCLGSMILARYLYPDHRLVIGHHIQPVAHNLSNLFSSRFNFLHSKYLNEERIEEMVIVDTRSRRRINEVMKCITDEPAVIIYDHHSEQEVCDFPQAELHEAVVGANATLLGLELIKRNITPRSDDATIALAAIYADTGNFTFDSTVSEDFRVAAFLSDAGGSLHPIRNFINPLNDDNRRILYEMVDNHKQNRRINGQNLCITYVELEQNTHGLAEIVSLIFAQSRVDAIFSFFYFQKSSTMLLIARSRNISIGLHELLSPFGGSGHPEAAALTLKKQNDGLFSYNKIIEYLEENLQPAVDAQTIMRTVPPIEQDINLLTASMHMESADQTGLPVVDADSKPVGFLTLRDIMKGRRGGMMHAPVKGYMSKPLISVNPQTTIHEIENLFNRKNIGRLPVVRDERIIGIVSRNEYIDFRKDESRFVKKFRRQLEGGSNQKK